MKINDWGNAGDDTDDKSPYTFSIGKNKSLILSGAGYVWLDLLDIDIAV